jgi:hypothetical protein
MAFLSYLRMNYNNHRISKRHVSGKEKKGFFEKKIMRSFLNCESKEMD